MFAQSVEEQAKLDAMQRHWQIRRSIGGGSSTSASLFDEVNETEELLTPVLSRQNNRSNLVRGQCVPPPPPTFTCSDVESDNEIWEVPESQATAAQPTSTKECLTLDASSLGDLPAHYKICALQPHQFPVVGVYIDKRVVPGFKYRVRPLPAIGEDSMKYKCIFNNRALNLKSIGRGYARRFTFEADKNRLNDNENYFWSDNRPEGYAFELELISAGDRFTIYDLNREAQGTVEVLKIESNQIEIGTLYNTDGIEKTAKVEFTGKVEMYETGVAKPMLLSGIVKSFKARNKGQAEIVKVNNVLIRKQRFYLVPGVQKNHRRVTVHGDSINDVPTKYTMTGLQPYEIPVVGTYVDPRIIPGFYYRVRPNDRKEHLFGGRALKLISIGMGYAKRLNFQPDSLVEPENYLWSDNHPDGLGLEPRAIHKNMKFTVKAGEQILGEATVFRADNPQVEEKMEKITTEKGVAIEKHIQVDVMCHIRLARTGGATTENENHLLRVYGVAVVRKEPRASEAQVVRIEKVAMDSQLNVLFKQMHTELTFIPK